MPGLFRGRRQQPFEFKAQHDFDLHIALDFDGVLQPMLAKGKAGLECRGVADHGMIDSIYFRDPNGYVIELTAKRADHDPLDPATNNARDASAGAGARGPSPRRRRRSPEGDSRGPVASSFEAASAAWSTP